MENLKTKIYQLVIFDLDGTLLNTLDDLCYSTNTILQKYGYPVHPKEAYRYFVGNGIQKLIERALPQQARIPETIETVYQDFMAFYSLHKMDKTAVYQGIMPVLKYLQSVHIKLAVASNKAHHETEALLKYYFPEIQFSAILGQRKGYPIKPSPEVVYEILKQAEVQASQTLYVGDTGTDMQTASKAGVFKIGVLWGFRDQAELLENGADYIASTPAEILHFFENI